jgi:hypothetical protein
VLFPKGSPTEIGDGIKAPFPMADNPFLEKNFGYLASAECR